MKKSQKPMTPQRKLIVHGETITQLKPRELVQVVGGNEVNSSPFCPSYV